MPSPKSSTTLGATQIGTRQQKLSQPTSERWRESWRNEQPSQLTDSRSIDMAKVKIKAKTGKAGTKLVAARLRITPTDSRKLQATRAIYQTRAQLNVHLLNQNGEPRARNRSD